MQFVCGKITQFSHWLGWWVFFRHWPWQRHAWLGQYVSWDWHQLPFAQWQLELECRKSNSFMYSKFVVLATMPAKLMSSPPILILSTHWWHLKFGCLDDLDLKSYMYLFTKVLCWLIFSGYFPASQQVFVHNILIVSLKLIWQLSDYLALYPTA